MLRTHFLIASLVLLFGIVGCKKKKNPDQVTSPITEETETENDTGTPVTEPVTETDTPSLPVDTPVVFAPLESDPFVRAWEDTLRPIIIDAYGPNGIDWAQMQTDPRVVAVIHKSSQGFNTDSKYLTRRDRAKDLGYKWGSYHLAKPGNPIEQADFYLETIENPDDELIALDLEGLDETRFMSLDDALIFIERIHEVTGNYPFVYCNHTVLRAISSRYGAGSLFSRCPLWYARFRTDIPNFNNRTWDTYTLWQFSCELNCNQTGTCLYNVPGTRYDMDINVFNGSTDELLANWPAIGK